MRVIYVDTKHHCHVVNDGTMNAVETDFFDEKCDDFVEGFCCDDSKGYIQIYAWKDFAELDAAQRQYEQALIADMQQALNTLGVNVNG